MTTLQDRLRAAAMSPDAFDLPDLMREAADALDERDELLDLFTCWYETDQNDTPHLGLYREVRDGGTRLVWILHNYWSECRVCEMGDGRWPKMNSEARAAMAPREARP